MLIVSVVKPLTSMLAFRFLLRSELTGTTFNKSRPNIPKAETEAVKILITLQKDKRIIIKPCDKGAGIFICNYEDYVKDSLTHLTSKINPDSPET
jgi:hypothetical protein